jgi:putative ABC transport system substrate-binding protein
MSRCLLLILAGILLWLGITSYVVPAVAAPPPPPLIAVILPRDNVRFQAIHAAFLKGIDSLTTVTGKPHLYVQSPNPDVMSLRNSIRKATALGADLIVVYGTRAATAAQQEDITEPLIFADVFDPVAMGLVPSLQHGGNLVTGVCGYAPAQTLLKAFHQTFGPGRLGVLVEAKLSSARLQSELLQSLVCRHDLSAGNGKRDASAANPCSL